MAAKRDSEEHNMTTDANAGKPSLATSDVVVASHDSDSAPIRAILDHIYLDVSDYDRSKAFFARALAPLDIGLVMERELVAGFGHGQKPELWIRSSQARPLDPCGSTTRQPPDETHFISPIHVAVGATSNDEVDSFYREALAAGGRDNGAPSLHPEYHPTYYSAFVLDPDGHNVEAVFHGF
jgi:catechol 2,3-dioxygenase-like lactoylglutathione lyase family enzyme